jgi:hypothetical protein
MQRFVQGLLNGFVPRVPASMSKPWTITLGRHGDSMGICSCDRAATGHVPDIPTAHRSWLSQGPIIRARLPGRRHSTSTLPPLPIQRPADGRMPWRTGCDQDPTAPAGAGSCHTTVSTTGTPRDGLASLRSRLDRHRLKHQAMPSASDGLIFTLCYPSNLVSSTARACPSSLTHRCVNTPRKPMEPGTDQPGRHFLQTKA